MENLDKTWPEQPISDCACLHSFLRLREWNGTNYVTKKIKQELLFIHAWKVFGAYLILNRFLAVFRSRLS
jgi:hypothetical protein